MYKYCLYSSSHVYIHMTPYVSTHTGKSGNELHQAFMKAGQEAGYPLSQDVNGYQQEGVGVYDMTIHNGKRWSTSQAYLRPALTRYDTMCVADMLVK